MIETTLPGSFVGVPVLENHFSGSVALALDVVADELVPVGPDELATTVQHVAGHLAGVSVKVGFLQTRLGYSGQCS